MKTTKWFPRSIKPVHIGCYQTRYDEKDDVNFNYWNGHCWLTTTANPKKPNNNTSSMVQDIQWRGLKEMK
jgi:hypothetical protein